ncbi:MAG: PilZ domain-containing protein [Pseudomonadota bacterium]
MDLTRGRSSSGEPGADRLRKFSRQLVSIRAFLHFGGRFQSTLIRDLSRSGAGLRGAVGVIPGDRVNIELLDGRAISGKVKWWLAGNCGVAFDTKLEENDPLLTGASKGSLRRSLRKTD